MKKMITYIIQVAIIMLILIAFKHYQGYENTVCFIAAMGLIELWSLKNDE